MDENQEIINNAKNAFNKDLLNDNYASVHYDEEHKNLLMRLLHPEALKNYLDLGTGNGYLAFEISNICTGAHVYGLDIAEAAVENNNKTVQNKKLRNISFSCYDGIKIPYGNEFFDGVITRYAVHHFPSITDTIEQVNEILKPGGYFIISDPAPDESDTAGFADKYMQLKNDGHVKLYNEKEFDVLLDRTGFSKEAGVQTKIKFPRIYGGGYQKLLDSQSRELVKKYMITIEADRIYMTLAVNNLVYKKRSV